MDSNAIQYRRLIGRFATGVAVVLAEADDKTVAGMTVNSMTSVSLDPLLLLFCTRNESPSAQKLLAAGRFSVNILGQQLQHISRRFACPSDRSTAGCASRDGFTWIEGANATFLCAVEHVYPGGDHKIIVGRVLRMFGPEESAEPLLFYEGRYAGLERPAHAA